LVVRLALMRVRRHHREQASPMTIVRKLEDQPSGHEWVKSADPEPRLQRQGGKMSARLSRLAARSLSNFRSLPPIVLNRVKNRPPVYPVLDWKLPLCFCLTIIFIAVLVLDAPLASFRGLWSPGIVAAAERTSGAGWAWWYIMPALGVALAVNLADWRRRTRRQLLVLYNWTCLSIFTLVVIGLFGLVVALGRRFIGRARPQFFADSGVLSFNPFAMDPYYSSLPSGHAATVGALAGGLVLFFPKSRYVVIPVAIWLAATRAVAGAHYPSDVVAGLALGFGASVLTAIVFARLGYVFRQKPAGLPEVKRSFRVLW
jgi:membrane-associated phospholipid phosphatase